MRAAKKAQGKREIRNGKHLVARFVGEVIDAVNNSRLQRVDI